MENRMNLVLVSSRSIVHTIFKLVCKKLNLGLEIVEDIAYVVSNTEFVIADEMFVEQINSVRKFAKKTAIITNEDINITYSVNFKIPNPFLPITLIEILNKEIENIKEETEIIKYKTKRDEQAEAFKKNLIDDENIDDSDNIENKKEEALPSSDSLDSDNETLDDVYNTANLAQDIEDELEEKQNEIESIEDLEVPILQNAQMPKIVTPPQNSDFSPELQENFMQEPIIADRRVHQSDDYSIDVPYFDNPQHNAQEIINNINIDFDGDDGYHEELNDIVAQVADQLNDDSKISVVEVEGARGGILNLKELESITNIINSKEMSLNEDELKEEENKNNFSGLDNFDNSRHSEVGQDFIALSDIIDQAIADASSIDDVMEDKGFGSTNIVYLKDYDVNELRPLLNKVNPLIIDSLKNEIPVKIELRLKRK